MNKLFILSISVLFCNNLIFTLSNLTNKEQLIYDYLIQQAKQGLETIPSSYKTEENIAILRKKREFLSEEIDSKLWLVKSEHLKHVEVGVFAILGSVLGIPPYVAINALNYFGNNDIGANIKTGALGLIIGSWVPYITSASYDTIAKIHNNLIKRYWKKQVDEIQLIINLKNNFRDYIRYEFQRKLDNYLSEKAKIKNKTVNIN